VGLILDSSVAIAAERRGDTIERLIQAVVDVTGDQEAALTVYPFTTEAAKVAGKLDGEQQSRGIVIPFGDLLIAATALSLGYSVLTVNLRHFQQCLA